MEENTSDEQPGGNDQEYKEIGPQPSLLPPPPEGCSPVEWVALRWEEVSRHRYFLCSRYGDCLEYAGLSAWQGMSCSRCGHFRKAGRQ